MAFLLRPTSDLSVNDPGIFFLAVKAYTLFLRHGFVLLTDIQLSAIQKRFKSPIQSLYINFRWPNGDISLTKKTSK
ncbi:MAG: hypothetical protein JWQ54_5062 [Mucilaginibacter sp.]|nr:hypothetical protein [Mucilaginibacter sp.]